MGFSSFDSSSAEVSNGLVGGSLRCSDNSFEVPEYLTIHFDMDDADGSDESSSTLGTDSQQTSASLTAETPTVFNLALKNWRKESAEGMWRRRLSTSAVAHARSPQSLELLLSEPSTAMSPTSWKRR